MDHADLPSRDGRRFPRQVAWARRRLDRGNPRGFWLTFTASAGALTAWAFADITQDVTDRDGMATLDPRVTAWAVTHRTGWLTDLMRIVTWLGSAAIIIPLAVVLGFFFVRRQHRWRPVALLGCAVAGAISLYSIMKPLVGRPRPPPAIQIGHFASAAFPSGHATQSVAFYATLAIVGGIGRSLRAKAVLWSVAVLIALAVGASRIYLGAHWLTDVLGGYVLGAFWIAVVVTMLTVWSRGTGGAKPIGPAGPSGPESSGG